MCKNEKMKLKNEEMKFKSEEMKLMDENGKFIPEKIKGFNDLSEEMKWFIVERNCGKPTREESFEHLCNNLESFRKALNEAIATVENGKLTQDNWSDYHQTLHDVVLGAINEVTGGGYYQLPTAEAIEEADPVMKKILVLERDVIEFLDKYPDYDEVDSI